MKKVVLGFVSAAALATVSMTMAGGMTNIPAPDQALDENSAGSSHITASDHALDDNSAGYIISGNLGYGKVNYNANTNPPLGSTPTNLNGFAWNINIGYQFNPYFALESGYTSFPDITLNPGEVQTSGLDFLGKGILPINEQFNVFAKAGAMNSFTKASAGGITLNRSRVVPEFGIGASYNVNSNVALTLQGITTLPMKGPSGGTFTMPATYIGYAGASYKFNV